MTMHMAPRHSYLERRPETDAEQTAALTAAKLRQIAAETTALYHKLKAMWPIPALMPDLADEALTGLDCVDEKLRRLAANLENGDA